MLFFLSLRGTSMKSRADAAPITSHACCSLTDPFVSHGEVLLWQDKAWPDLTKWNCFTAFIFFPFFWMSQWFLMSIWLQYADDPSWSRNPNPKSQEYSVSNTPNLLRRICVYLCVHLWMCVCTPIIILIPHVPNPVWPVFVEEIEAVGCSWDVSNPIEWMRSDRGIKAQTAMLHILNT